MGQEVAEVAGLADVGLAALFAGGDVAGDARAVGVALVAAVAGAAAEASVAFVALVAAVGQRALVVLAVLDADRPAVRPVFVAGRTARAQVTDDEAEALGADVREDAAVLAVDDVAVRHAARSVAVWMVVAWQTDVAIAVWSPASRAIASWANARSGTVH